MNPRIIVHVAEAGAPLSNGEPSLTGHMWVTLTDEYGNQSSYGFAPKTDKDPWGPGKVYDTDESHYIDSPSKHDYEREITQDQFDKVRDFAENAKRQAENHSGRWADYEGPTNSCVDFTWGAINAGGLAGNIGEWQGNVLPGNNQSDLGKYFAGQKSSFEKWRDGISDAVNNAFNAAKNWTPPRDPLILDLDGNGIQTRAIDPAAPILFDHNADGIKTGTGWVGASDGMVVLDLDGNGSIDSGRELFGDNTVITSGARAGQLAANGFDAIAQYDADADGAINSSDAIYSQLRIWQDGNADDISQSAELKTLAELGIASIGVAGQTDSSSLGGGNTQAQKGSFTRTDGSSGDSASVQLAANNFYREFTDDPALVQAAMQKAQFVANKAHFIAAIF